MVGLYNKPGRGSKPLLNASQKAQVKEWAKQEPRQLKKVSQKVQEAWGIRGASQFCSQYKYSKT